MNIDKLKHQHEDILGHIAALREQVKAGIDANAAEISRLVIAMSSTIRLHLAVEDKLLYPALQQSNNALLASMGRQFQDEMQHIAASYMAFAHKWNTPAKVTHDPEGFRAEANEVLKALYLRMQKENTRFYPLIEAHEPARSLQ